MINNNFSLGMISFSNGIYQGLINNSQREGIGIYIWDNGQIYIGKNRMLNKKIIKKVNGKIIILKEWDNFI